MNIKWFTMQAMLTTNEARVAVVGAGIAGAASARTLRHRGPCTGPLAWVIRNDARPGRESGDFLGGMGVEGAWLSGQALASALCASTVPATLPRLAA
jgi:glycine/D-amino acid oxidase-like deaminating enzyme